MSRSLKHLIPVLLLAGTVLGGASLVRAHSGHDDYDHEHTQYSGGACAYACALKGHGKFWYTDCWKCWCKG